MFAQIKNAIRGGGRALPENVPASENNPVVVQMKSMQATKSTQTLVRPRNVSYRIFTAGKVDRSTFSWITQDIAINALLQSQLSIMRARSRYLTRNTSPGRRFLTLVRNNVIGPDGIRVQSRCGEHREVEGVRKWVLDTLANDAIERHFSLWSKAKHCDATGQFDMDQLCRLWAASLAQDGEVLIKEVVGTKATPYRYQLQTLAIDRLDINYNGTAANGNQVRMGVERDEVGKPVACYVLLRNPNDSLSLGMQKHDRIGLDEVIHRFVPVDPEQIRGFPWTHAVMGGEKMLQMFQEAAMGAAVVGAQSMGFYVPPKPGDDAYTLPGEGTVPGAEVADGQDANGDLMKDAIGGAFEILPPGYDFKKFDPNYPHAAYQPFVQEHKRDLAVGLDVAHHNLSGDMTGVNYSSARIAELQERDVWRGMQRFFISRIFSHIIERWLEMGLLAGAITMDNGSALPLSKHEKFREGLKYIPRGWDWVDPKNEINAAISAIGEALTTRTKVVESKGGNLEENIIELAREEELFRQHNVKVGQKPNQPQAEPAPKSEDTNEPNGAE